MVSSLEGLGNGNEEGNDGPRHKDEAPFIVHKYTALAVEHRRSIDAKQSVRWQVKIAVISDVQSQV